MNIKDIETLKKIVGLMSILGKTDPAEKVSMARKPGYMEMFSRFPKDLHDALNSAITPEDNNMHEALLCACTWLAETEQKLEKAGDKIDVLQKQKTTLDAQLSGQRDRMTIQDRTLGALDGKITKMQAQITKSLVELKDRDDAQQNTSSLHDRQIISQSKALSELQDRAEIHSQGLDAQRERMNSQVNRADGQAMSIVDLKTRVSSLEELMVSVPSTQEKQL